jgi:hypothetical protein
VLGNSGSEFFIAEANGVRDKGTGNNTAGGLSGGLPHLGTILQLQKYLDFWRISI